MNDIFENERNHFLNDYKKRTKWIVYTNDERKKLKKTNALISMLMFRGRI